MPEHGAPCSGIIFLELIMLISQTAIATPEWIAGQSPDQWLKPSEIHVCHLPLAERRRVDKVAGRLALKRLLWESFHVDPLAYEVGSDGPAPCLKGWPGPDGLVVSLSHSHGLGAASWAWQSEEETVGLDVQKIQPVHPRLKARFLSPEEQAQAGDLLLFWAIKEAAIKARRQVWGRPLRDIAVTLSTSAGQFGTARVILQDEPELTASYSRYNDWWTARVSRPSAYSIYSLSGRQRVG